MHKMHKKVFWLGLHRDAIRELTSGFKGVASPHEESGVRKEAKKRCGTSAETTAEYNYRPVQWSR